MLGIRLPRPIPTRFLSIQSALGPLCIAGNLGMLHRFVGRSRSRVLSCPSSRTLGPGSAHDCWCHPPVGIKFANHSSDQIHTVSYQCQGRLNSSYNYPHDTHLDSTARTPG